MIIYDDMARIVVASLTNIIVALFFALIHLFPETTPETAVPEAR